MTIAPRARLLFGCGLLASSVVAADYRQALLVLGSAVLTTLLLNAEGLLGSMWRYLRWFLLPIILLHLLFTPGMLLLPALPWSPSQEGVDAALWQALRLINWFLCGGLLARLLSHQEWRQLLGAIPGVGRHWATILTALPPLLQRLRQLLLLMRWRWRQERGGRRDIAAVASAVVAAVLVQGAAQADAHWLSQQVAQPVGHANRPAPNRQGWLQAGVVACGWIALWGVW